MNSQLTSTDQAYLARALKLAEYGRGNVSPNPLVGAVVVRDGETLGEGWHAELGGLHAERAALADCARRGADSAGATMFVTLEPCAHQGRQPPCVEAVLEAGIARVVVASDDPSEKTAGRGPAILRESGVEVVLAGDPRARQARLLNQPFRKHARTGLPLVVLKLAISLDGRTATAPGDSRWISGEQSRALVHRWRAESDAIAAGIGTVLADDPLLTARPVEQDEQMEGAGDLDAHPLAAPRQPLRVVFDSQARLPLDSRLLATLDQSPVLVVTAPDADPARLRSLESAGAEVQVASGSTSGDRIASALESLGDRGVTSLFLEGGRTLATAFQLANQLDESRTFIAPVLIGGQAEGDLRAGGVGRGRVEDDPARSALPLPATGPARRIALTSSTEPVGDDVLMIARFEEW